MKKSIRNLIIGIGILSIISGIYSSFIEEEWSNTLFSIVIGLSLLVSVYVDQTSKKDEGS